MAVTAATRALAGALLAGTLVIPVIFSAAGARAAAPPVAAAAARPSTVVAAPANVGSTGCVTRAEYRAAKHGMTKARVHRIFGTRGTLIYLIQGNEERRAYRMCDRTLRLNVVYLRGTLGYKKLRAA